MEDFAAYEGLVYKTAYMFSGMVGLEPEDMQQELRIKIIKSQRAYNPARSAMSERAYVYACVANLVKDLKKCAARRSGVSYAYLDDPSFMARSYEPPLHMTEEQAFRLLGHFTMPSSVTDEERQVIALLVIGYDHQEIADMLGVAKTQVAATLKNLREKLADWRPEKAPLAEAPAEPLAVAV